MDREHSITLSDYLHSVIVVLASTFLSQIRDCLYESKVHIHF
jgi:hypothetical protein